MDQSIKATVLMRINKLYPQLKQMEAYLDLKRAQDDWHGIMDASADIREMRAELKAFSDVLELINQLEFKKGE